MSRKKHGPHSVSYWSQGRRKPHLCGMRSNERYDAVCYGDTNGFDYVCCEIFSQDAIVGVTLCEAVEA